MAGTECIVAPNPNRIIGYTFDFADWKDRYQKEKDAGKLIDNLKNVISIDKQTMQGVDGSIFTKELGELTNTDKDIREFSCDCGHMCGRFFEGSICPECGTEVKSRYLVDLKRGGWIVLTPPYMVITPNAYDLISKCVGVKNLKQILYVEVDINIDGLPQEHTEVAKSGNVIPYSGIGMLEFYNKFEEILLYYASIRNTSDIAMYLIEHKNVIFVDKIFVPNIFLRQTFVSSKKRSVSYDKLNVVYEEIVNNASLIKRRAVKHAEYKRNLNLVFDIQQNLQELYAVDVIKDKLSGKTKQVRGAILGNRMNFSARMVIRSFVGPYSGMDKVEMSYKGFVELNKPEIIAALLRGYGPQQYTRYSVYELLELIQISLYSNDVNPVVWEMANVILENREANPAVLLRPPSLALGSLQYFDVCRLTKNAYDKTLGIPLSSLAELNGDYDGDCLSVFAPKEKRVVQAFKEGLSPKRLIIDRSGDKSFNDKFGLIKDEITSLVSLLS